MPESQKLTFKYVKIKLANIGVNITKISRVPARYRVSYRASAACVGSNYADSLQDALWCGRKLAEERDKRHATAEQQSAQSVTATTSTNNIPTKLEQFRVAVAELIRDYHVRVLYTEAGGLSISQFRNAVVESASNILLKTDNDELCPECGAKFHNTLTSKCSLFEYRER